MLTNPYPHPTDADDKDALRFQTYLSGEDKALLMSVRPARGTAQTIVNNLIKHICDDLRELNITSFRVDADDILCVLTERRPLTSDQVSRLRRTTFGASAKVPKGLFNDSRGTEVRKGTTNAKVGANHTKSEVGRG